MDIRNFTTQSYTTGAGAAASIWGPGAAKSDAEAKLKEMKEKYGLPLELKIDPPTGRSAKWAVDIDWDLWIFVKHVTQYIDIKLYGDNIKKDQWFKDADVKVDCDVYIKVKIKIKIGFSE